jgi:HTH-type transcriptional regulator / antitoxin HigA
MRIIYWQFDAMAVIAVSTISEVLCGKRTLNRDHIGRLARYFHVSPDTFAF